jgi:hypothetical protein
MFGASKYNALLKHPGYNDPFSAIATVAGGLISKSASDKQAKATTTAASTSAAAQEEAARLAAEESRFRPVDLNTLFGNVDWTWGDDGRVSGVDVSTSPFTQGLFGDAGNIYQAYYDMLKNYVSPDIYSGAANIYGENLALQQPAREWEQAQLFDAMQNKGITGIEGYDPNTGANVNPYTNSLFGAWAAKDQQLAYDSVNEYLSRIRGLTGDVSTARTNMIGVGQLPYDTALKYSMEIGGRSANPTGASLLGAGLSNAAQTQAQGAVASAAYKNQFWNSFSQPLGSTIGSAAQTAWNNPGLFTTPYGAQMYSAYMPSATSYSGINDWATQTGYTIPGSQQSSMLASQW